MENTAKKFALQVNPSQIVVFRIPEELIIPLTGEQMRAMDWEIGDDSPQDEYELSFYQERKIKAAIRSSNEEYSDSGFTFDFEETIADLFNNGYIRVSEDGILEPKH